MHGYRSKRADIGRQRSRELIAYFGRELRVSRVSNGLTQEQVARLAGVSQGLVSQAERGLVACGMDVMCRLAAAAGTDLSLKLFPTSTVSLRDSGQLHDAETIVNEADRSWRARMEVPVGGGRAHDVVLDRSDEVVAIEIERAFVVMEAQARRALVKRDALAERESRAVRLVLAVPDTERTRALVREHADFMFRSFPVPSRAIWRAIRVGRPVGGDGILFVPRRKRISATTTRTPKQRARCAHQ
jgi:transcriptional regulator with XRE-family HTH domain